MMQKNKNGEEGQKGFPTLNKKYTQIACYVVVTCIVIYCLSLVADNMPSIVKAVMNKLSWLLKVIKPVILGFILAYLLEPLVTFFQRQFERMAYFRKNQRKARYLAVFLIVLLAVLLVAVMVSLLVFSITDQIRLASLDDLITLSNQYAALINDFTQTVRDKLSQLNIESAQLSEYIKQASSYLLGMLQKFANGVVGSVGNISGFVTTAAFGIIIGIYFLIDGTIIMDYLSKVSRALLNGRTDRRIRGVLGQADTVFSGYIRGQLMDAFVMMFLISFGLSMIGVKFGIVIGILAGVGNLIPYFGPFVAYAGTIIVCLLNGQYPELVKGLIFLIVIQGVDGNFIGPKLLSQSINIHPLLVIIFLIFGSALGGFGGMLLAVPVGAFIKELFVQFIDRRLKQKEVSEAFAACDIPEPEEKKKSGPV